MGGWYRKPDRRFELNSTMKRLLLLPLLALSLLFCHSEEKAEVKVETLAKATTSWNDSILPAYPEGQPEITVLKIDIPPHTTLDLHQHPVINAGVLLKGQLTVVAENGQTLEMKTGDALVELVNTYHYGTNPSDETAQIIVFYAGIKDEKITEYKIDK